MSNLPKLVEKENVLLLEVKINKRGSLCAWEKRELIKAFPEV